MSVGPLVDLCLFSWRRVQVLTFSFWISTKKHRSKATNYSDALDMYVNNLYYLSV